MTERTPDIACYDKDGQEIGFARWAELMGDEDYRTVASDEVPGLIVSTVWIGLDHSFGGGPPVIFETMTFGLDDDLQHRYATIDDARVGHAAIVKEHLSVIDKLAAVVNDE